jgi:Carboxypeptidase regulatory-like domain
MDVTTAGCPGGRLHRAARVESASTVSTARRVLMLGALLGVVLLAGPAESAFGDATLGAISGTVTDASSHAPLKGIEVCAYDIELLEEEEQEEPGRAFGCVDTDASGQYTIDELMPEQEGYDVVFKAPPESKLNYITQFYEGVLPPAEPTFVTVTAAKTTSGVDAALAPGAQIAGTVKDASTGTPIKEAVVYALRAPASGPLEVVSYARTGANGEYVVEGLPSGSYDVAFDAQRYAVQYYRDAPSLAEASAVSVTAPRLSSSIDAALLTGTAALSPLTFTPSSVTPPGARSPGTRPGATTLPGGPPSPGSAGTLSLAGTRIAVQHNGVALVKVRCSESASCQARITLKMVQVLGGKGKATRREVAIGTSPVVSVGAAQKAIVKIKLDRAGRSALSAHHWHLDVDLVLVAAAGTRDTSVVLTTASQSSEQIFTRVPIVPTS